MAGIRFTSYRIRRLRAAGGAVCLVLAMAAGSLFGPAIPLQAASSVAVDEPAPVRLTSSAGLRNKDIDPASGVIPAFSAAAAVAVDYQRRSVAVDLGVSSRVQRFELVGRSSTSRITADDYTVWISDDNRTYVQVDTWSMSPAVVDQQLIHTFALDVETRYLKVNTRYEDSSYTFVLANARDDFRVYGQPGEPEVIENETGLEVVGKGTIFVSDATPAYRPALTRAPNGDILVAFNTSSDVHPGGEIWVSRSSDEGLTWGQPTSVASPQYFEGGAIHSSRGMTTLSDGTILLPYNDGVNYSRNNFRDSVLFVARSDDSGRTWTGTDNPVELPLETQEHWAGSRILELADGSLLMSLWGTLDHVDDWQTDPQRTRAATIKSHDGGRTWTDYATVGYDPHTPADHIPTSDEILNPYGINEHALVELADGRIMSVMRSNGSLFLPNPYRSYVSWSEDGGLSWSAPVAIPLPVETPSLATAPCSADLPDGRSKVIFGYRNRADHDAGVAEASVSYDGGATWHGTLRLEDPVDRPAGQFVSAEPDFLPLDGSRMLVAFQSRVAPEKFGLSFNILQDQSAADCRNSMMSSDTAATTDLAIFLERGDKNAWPFALGRSHQVFPADMLVKDAAVTAARSVTCSEVDISLIHNGVVLDPDRSLAAVGLRTGDVVSVQSSSATPNRWNIGFSDRDLYPESRRVYAWDRACSPRALAVDQWGRSMGLDVDLGPLESVTAVSFTDSDAATRLTAEDYSLLASTDNDTYVPVTGWTLTPEVVDGRITHTFSGLDVRAPYLKVHTRYTDAARTFVLSDPRSDVRVEITAADCDRTVTGAHAGSLTVEAGTTCLRDATIGGQVRVQPGGTVLVENTVLNGGFEALQAAGIWLCGAEVRGGISIAGSTGPVVLGGTRCAGSTVNGRVSLTGNVGGTRVSDLTLSGSLACTSNDPAPLFGSANGIAGSRSGQCSVT